jgi:membrane dipeptidase
MKLSKDQIEHAEILHKQSYIVDFHCDGILATLPDSAYDVGGAKKRTLDKRSDHGHVDIPRLLEGGVNCQVFSHFVEPIYNQIAPQRMLQVLGYALNEFEKNNDINLATSYDDLMENKGNRISAIIGFEGAEAVVQDLRLLRVYHKIGLRRLTLTWNNRNYVADGVTWQRSKGGLTEFGEQLVEECNKLGIFVDVSHITDQGFWDVLEVSKEPVIASHSNCRALCDHQRNLTDEMIMALIEKKGIIGVNFVPFFLTPLDFQKLRSGDKNEAKKAEEVTVETVVDHIDYIKELVGKTKNIGLGSDFDGVPMIAKGLEDVSKLSNLTKSLVAREYTDTEIKGILGENFLGYMKKILR